MASPAAATPDTLVTLKVNYDGNPRRFKLPLHDLVATTLEGKLRTFLSIPTGTACTIERYSDSAATYVVLDPTVVSVYKQLYRAAKAKQKLKLRVTTKQEATESKMVPKPVTVEDEPEPSQKATTTPDLIKIDDPVITPSFTAVPPRTSPAQVPNPILSATNELMLGKSIALAERGQKVMERNLKILEASVAKLNIDPSLKPNAAATRLAFDYLRDAAQNQTPPAVPKPPSEGRRSAVEVPVITTRANFTVCCNSCDNTIPDSHYHCATCDDGDFDLCQDCVDKGISCYGVGHWLIRRSVKNGVIISSITERIAPKPKIPSVPVMPTPAPVFKSEPTPPSLIDEMPLFSNYAYNNIRTCNSCVQELPDHDFVHCMTCDDYDLCKACFAKDQHGHHPKHAFVVVAPDSFVSDEVTRRLAAGRNQRHNAICDGCDKYIVGVRNKCLDCPDWDYCGECILNASFIHPSHRFVPVYEPIADTRRRLILATRAVHVGISCDGPLCSGPRSGHRFIRGERYKCAVCHDTDFCANCEASPANTHNPTHPLIKFKTPVRHVSVTTTGEHEDGNRMPTMGDRILRTQPSTSSRATETTATNQPIAATNVQTVVDVKPSEPAVKIEEKEIKEEATPAPTAIIPAAEPSADELSAVYVKDTVADGTVMPPDHVFEQTWVLRNSGNVPWPAGCAVKYVGGDYMGHVDPKHPVAIQKLVSASESTVCYTPLAPNQSYPFTVLLRTPPREGKFISYWRLTTKEGIKFGHRLWCDVAVEQAKPVEEKGEEKKVEVPQTPPPAVEKPKSDAASSTTESSQMIFPKLEKESPVASIHEEAKAEDNSAAAPAKEAEDFEQCDEDDEWAEDDSDEEGVNTDEEYDILDASDEEPLDEHQK